MQGLTINPSLPSICLSRPKLVSIPQNNNYFMLCCYFSFYSTGPHPLDLPLLYTLAGILVHPSSPISPKFITRLLPSGPNLPCKSSQFLFVAVSGLHLKHFFIFGSSFSSIASAMKPPIAGMWQKPWPDAPTPRTRDA